MTIDRAIGLLKMAVLMRAVTMSEFNDFIEAVNMAIEALENLPSAQPEIIRCKDCKYSDENWQRVSVRWLPCMDMRTGSNWYCGSAERREE